MNSTYTCQYRGHEEEPIIGLCLFRECENKPQYCGECLMSHHSPHMKNCKSMIKLKQMINGFQTEIIDWLQNIEGQYQKIQANYQYTVKLLTNVKNRMIEFEKYLLNEEYQQITEKIIVIKQINILQETKQDIKQKNILEMLKYINDQLESLKFEQRDVDDLQIVEISQTSYISDDSKILQNQIDLETEQLIQNSKNKTQEGIEVINISGKIHIDNGRYQEAISCLDDAIKINDKNNVAYREKGWALIKQRKNQEAIEYLDKAILLDNKDAIPFYEKGIALHNLKCYEEALKCYDQAIQLDPQYKDAYNNKGIALRNLNRYEEAIKCYDQTIQLDPLYKDAYNNKGVALRNLNRNQEAIKCYDQAIQLDPQFTLAINNKRFALSEMEKNKKTSEKINHLKRQQRNINKQRFLKK